MTQPVSAPAIRARKGSAEPLVMVTAYDAPGARIVDDGGADLILVGDSVAMVVLGYEDTLSVTVDDIVHHVAAVARAKPTALIVADMPWLSYHVSVEDTVCNAARLVRAGAAAVKLEGGRKRIPMVRAILDAEVPVMGHVGLTPQSVHAMGGFKVQGREVDAASELISDAHALADAGCFAIVLEGVPDTVAKMITETVPVPTIGIGAGPDCDGQVLVFHDLLGLQDRLTPKFVRRYASLKDDAVAAVAAYAADVRARRFPSDEESYHLSPDVARRLKARRATATPTTATPPTATTTSATPATSAVPATADPAAAAAAADDSIGNPYAG
jgi:3-methyl-2-oxobutanoate hydroxymethyltransferase